MIISNIEISQFRNYSRFSTNLSPELNWIHGSNGQGKTNLVEAIHYLCNLESFRTRKISPIIQKSKQEAMIKAQVDHRQVKKYVRINISRKGRQVFIDNTTFNHVSEYILSYMALAFTPDSVGLFRNAPHDRRKFFNKIISFLEPIYFKNLHEYTKIIAQKNALLRNGNIDQIPIWNQMLARSAIKLMEKRKKFVDEINVYLNAFFMELTGRSEVLTLLYEPSFNFQEMDERKFFEILEKNLTKDLQYGFSLLGPHRDEFRLLLNKKKDREYFSQGEFRITNLSLKMTINRLLYDKYKFYPILIFDDLFSELDDVVIKHVLQLFIKIKNQIFITSTSKPSNSLQGKYIKISQGMLA